MRIVTLVENLVYQSGLLAEHGLSFYIDTGSRKILFDTGQQDTFMKNALHLGIDLHGIDAVVISHGHYDHMGGLYAFLKVNNHARVYVKKEAFQQKYHGNRFIGIPFDDTLLKGRIHWVTEKTEIGKGLHIMPHIPIRDRRITHFENFQILTPEGFRGDEFEDELYLALPADQELSVVSSCSHRGIINILEGAEEDFKLPIGMILGGFHIRNSNTAYMDVLVDFLNRLNPRSIGVCHCTGVEKYAELQRHFREKVFYNATGNEVLING